MSNRSQIRNECRQTLNDLASVLFTDADLNNWIDLWEIETTTRLEFKRTSSTINTVLNEPNYNLGDHIYLFITEVYLEDKNGNKTRIDFITQEELNDKMGKSWLTDPAGPPKVAYLADHNVLGLFPKPDSDSSGKVLTVYGVREPSGLGSDTTVPVFISALHASAPWYVASIGYGRLGDVGKSEYHHKRFEEMFSRLRHMAWKRSDDLIMFRW